MHVMWTVNLQSCLVTMHISNVDPGNIQGNLPALCLSPSALCAMLAVESPGPGVLQTLRWQLYYRHWGGSCITDTEVAAVLQTLRWQLYYRHWGGSCITDTEVAAVLQTLRWQLYYRHWGGSCITDTEVAAVLQTLRWQLYYRHWGGSCITDTEVAAVFRGCDSSWAVTNHHCTPTCLSDISSNWATPDKPRPWSSSWWLRMAWRHKGYQ